MGIWVLFDVLYYKYAILQGPISREVERSEINQLRPTTDYLLVETVVGFPESVLGDILRSADPVVWR